MYIINFSGTRKEFCDRLKEFRKAKKDFAKTIGVPAPMEIYPIMKIVENNIKDEDFKLIIEGEKLKEKGTE